VSHSFGFVAVSFTAISGIALRFPPPAGDLGGGILKLLGCETYQVFPPREAFAQPERIGLSPSKTFAEPQAFPLSISITFATV